MIVFTDVMHTYVSHIHALYIASYVATCDCDGVLLNHSVMWIHSYPSWPSTLANAICILLCMPA